MLATSDVGAHLGRGVGDPPLKGVSPLPPTPTREEEARKVFHQLTPQQQKKLLDELSADQLLATSGKSAKEREVGMWAEAVHKALQEAMGSVTVDLPGVQVVRRLLGPEGAWQHVRSFMEVSRLHEGTVQERQLAYHVLASLLVSHARTVARKTGAPLGPKLVANCTVNLPGVFDASFPGYLASGLARLVVRSAGAA